MSEPQQPPYPAQGQPNQHPPANPAPAWPTAQPLGQPQPAAPYQGYPQQQAAPGYPQQGPGFGQQGASGYPQQGPAASQNPPAQAFTPQTSGPYGAPSTSGGLGRTAFILGLATIAAGLVGLIVSRLVLAALDYSTYSILGVVTVITGMLVFALSAATLITGLIAIRRPGPKLLAGIAVGIGATEVAGSVITFIANLLYSF